MGLQIGFFEYGVYILVGMLGWILDYLSKDCIDFSEFNILVLDEVDCMFEMGF